MKSQTVFVFLLSIVFTLVNEIAGEPPVTYLGCFEDGGPSNRLMTGLHENFHGSLTPDKCNEHCRGKGFAYAGTQYSYECFCSRTKPPEGKKSLESDCNSKCAGDETKNCGGTNRLAIFTTGFPDPTGGEGEGLVSLGCFKDSDKNRVLAEYRQDFPGALTNQKCVRLCTKRGYRHAGTEYGRECYCGNKTPSFKQYANDEECSKRCEGDVNQLCGGGWRIFVFKTSNGDQQGPLEAGKYVGCFKDQESPRNLDGHMEDFGSFLTHFKCTGLCYSKGFLYAGTQFSSQCFCGDKPPSPISKTADSECNKPCSGNKAEMCGGDWRNSIRETGIPDVPVEGKYLGCFNDLNNQIYGDVKLTFEKANSPRRCMNYCSQLGYKFSGVEYGKECFCGHKEPSTELVVNPEECNMACPGDSEESCGSGWRLAVYTTGTGGNVITNRFKVTTPKPCLPTETIVSGKEVCKGDVIFEDHFNTPLGNTWSHIVMIPDDPSSRLDSNGNPRARNINNKRKRHIKYPNKESSAIHEYSSAIPESSSVAHESSSAIHESSSVAHESSSAIPESSSAIPESASVIHESVEFLGVFVVKPTYTDENTYFGETVASRIKDLSCSNQVLARNRINSILMELEQEELKNVHKRVKGLEESDDHSSNCPEAAADHATSSMPQDNNAEEFEYAVFTAKPENSFTRKNKLIIKPTFHDDTFIQTGFLHLDGCTGREGSRQCELQAASYNIIPPLATARINTRNSFNFRYGIVEIRAKLPVGDWLVPELWLEPRNHFYGPGYASGRIRIAMNRGNADFKCQGEDYGWNRLESGVVMGSSDNVQKRSLTTKLPANWHDNFHNYTLIWSPDSIAFRIDNGQAQELIPAGQRLCETIGFQGEQCLIWNSGSRIAPFDKDFYISLGLSVGNNRDFPDGCTNRGQPKPWKNGDLKATLKFWLDKENWKATWTEENSSLQIEHIRVTAL